MVFFFMLAIWIFVRFPPTVGRDIGVVLVFGLSILVKFVTILVVPFLLLAITFRHNNGLKRGIILFTTGCIIVLQVVLLLWPLWPGWEAWALPVAGRQAGRSLMALLILGLRHQVGTNTAFDMARGILLLLFGAIYLWQLWQVVRRPDPRQLIAACFTAFFWYVLLLAPVFHAWYLLWFLPLAPLLLPQLRPLRATIVFSMTALLIIPYFETIRVWYPVLLANHFLGHLIGVPLLIVPPTLAYLWPIRPNNASKVSSRNGGRTDG
jgi:hypothetical protein